MLGEVDSKAQNANHQCSHRSCRNKHRAHRYSPCPPDNTPCEESWSRFRDEGRQSTQTDIGEQWLNLGEQLKRLTNPEPCAELWQARS